MIQEGNIHRLAYQDKDVILVGTAHISRESAELVKRAIAEESPDTVCVELCRSRYESMTQRKAWQDTDLIKAIKEKKAFLLLSNLMLASFQKKIGQKLGIKPGQEMLQALETAEAVGAGIILADREIRVTLARTWRLMGLWAKVKLFAEFLSSVGNLEEIKEEDIEKLKEQDVLEALLAEIGESLPELRRILIDERDRYLAYKIRTAPGKKIVAVVGAGHVPGIQQYWEKPVDIESLEQMPPKGRLLSVLKWVVPALICALIILGFFTAGKVAAAHMITWWLVANGSLAGLGAALALGHPLTVLCAVLASPLTSLNPMIAAGWVAGVVEALLGKPKVKDFEKLPEDIASFKGFWRNKITRVLMVVVFTNIGSALGAFVAIPLMLKVLA
jgi:pheromone shutdown-related protein TraB